MKCREFVELVIDLARGEGLATAGRAAALSHAELCIGCAARLAEERAWLANVRLVTTELASQEAPARVEAALLAALRTQRHPVPQPQRITFAWLAWRWAAMATAMLVVLGLTGWAWLSFGSQEKSQEALHLPASPPTPTPPVPTLQEDAKERAVPEPVPVRLAVHRGMPQRFPRTTTRSAPPNEPPAPFYSLVEDGQMAPLESGRIVRIEVPAAELVKLGVPLTDTTLTQPMQADLLLGQDGLARAIRFVPISQTTRMQ